MVIVRSQQLSPTQLRTLGAGRQPLENKNDAWMWARTGPLLGLAEAA